MFWLKPLTVEQATADIKLYSDLIGYARRVIDERLADIAEYSDKLARAAHYLAD